MKKILWVFILIMLVVLSCKQKEDNSTESGKNASVTISHPVIEVYGSRALDVLDTSATLEVLAKGFFWSEGPLWIEALQSVIFSDVPANKIYRWNEKNGLSVYLEPAGYTKNENDNKGEGSNGLILDKQGRLILCQHGDRRVARMDAELDNPAPKFTTIADNYNGKKFNSPNDLVMDKSGNIYFTDPPYGRPNNKTGEIGINGVYRINIDGKVELLVDSLTWPNGIALSPDEKMLYVNQSDPNKPHLYRFEISEDRSLTNGKILFDYTPFMKSGKGLPDGIKIHKSGHIFATGPGGVHIISPEGIHLALIRTDKATANCAFDKDQTYLYMTTTDNLIRVRLK